MIKALALTVSLLLQLSGLWIHIPASLRSHVTSAAADPQFAFSDPPPAAFQSLPVQISNPPLSLTAGSAYAIDADTDTVLYANNANAQRPIASITKLVTTMVVLSDHAPSDIITVPKLPAYAPDDELIGLVPGEQYTVRDLVTAALVQSGDDAADAMSLWDGRTKQAFAAKMNAKMAEWGIKGTHFASPSGLQDQNNYATAAAVAKIAKLALVNPLIDQVVDMPNATITSQAGRTITLSNIDTLLATGQFYGIKTGYTQAAGECFVGLTSIDGHRVITVVLGSEDRFGDTVALTNWIQNNYKWL